MAGFLMQKKKVDLVLVGADRIAKNGDFANKVGTYGLAVLSKAHGIPMYTLAPRTTFDPETESGDQIQIEERNPEEVRGTTAPQDTQVWNPAFDVTPRHWISGVIFEDGTL
jgi:methylthioribose-1-phosphate isomerase